MNRTNFRPRTIDPSKPLQIIKDVNDISKRDDSNSLIWVGSPQNEGKSIVEQEIKRIMELFDKKKTIIIPGVEKFEKPQEPQQKQNGEGKFSTFSVSYKQTEFTRPKHNIVFSERNRLEPKIKDYEASVYDLNFLKYENNIISVDELERVISALENDINKGEMIPHERAREIIQSIIPDKKQHVEKIYKVSNYFIIFFLNTFI